MDPRKQREYFQLITITVLLLLQVALDASGDAFRFRTWQKAHHSMEVVHVALWFDLWACFGFKWRYFLLYILGRLWLFNIVFNLWCGWELLYMGTTDPVDISIRWFADLVKQNYMHFSFMLKLLSLIGWVSVYIKVWRRVS